MGMLKELYRDAHAVLFPAFADLELDKSLVCFLSSGGKALLLGETREEYVARRMSGQRKATETSEKFRKLAAQARGLAGPVLIGVDQELAGIQRLEGLVPSLPNAEEARSLSTGEIEAAAQATAEAARGLGVNLFLSPIIDIVRGPNPWLAGRTLGTDIDEVARIAAAFIRGVQAGEVAAAAKHFPGHHTTVDDPALFEASVPGAAGEIMGLASPFRVAVNSGVKVIMMGPALVPALDEQYAASTSPEIVRRLREEFGFKGLIMSDDLDAPGILRGMALKEAAIASLKAGVDLLLLASGPHLSNIAAVIVDAVQRGELPASRLREAADRVRRLTESTN